MADRHHIDVSVDVRARPGSRTASTSQDIDARMRGGVLGPSFGGMKGDVEVTLSQPPGNNVSAGVVLVTGRVDRWHADEIHRTRDDFIPSIVDCPENAVGIACRAAR
jgi:hypothetical protein